MKNITIAAALAAVTLPATATAQTLEGAFFRFEGQHYWEDGGYTASGVDASAQVSFAFASGFGVQLGLNGFADIATYGYGTTYGAELHGFYDVSDTLRLGMLGTWDSFNGGDWFLGAEGVFASGPVRLEGRIGHYFSDSEPAWLYAAYGSYAIAQQLRLRGGLRFVDYGPDGYYRTASLGASYDVSDRIRLYADYACTNNYFGPGEDYPGGMIAAGVVISIGGAQNDRLFTYTPYY